MALKYRHSDGKRSADPPFESSTAAGSAPAISDVQQRYCSLCKLYFDTVNSLKKHQVKAHVVVATEARVQEALELTFWLRQEHVERLKWEIEVAQEEELELERRTSEQEDVLYENERLQEKKWLQWKREMYAGRKLQEQQFRSRGEKACKSQMRNRIIWCIPQAWSNQIVRKPSNTLKTPSIQILAIIPGDKIIPTKGRAKPARAKTLKNGIRALELQTGSDLADRFCLICKVTCRTAERLKRHNLKVHGYEGLRLPQSVQTELEEGKRSTTRQKNPSNSTKRNKRLISIRGRPSPILPSHCPACTSSVTAKSSDSPQHPIVNVNRQAAFAHQPSKSHGPPRSRTLALGTTPLSDNDLAQADTLLVKGMGRIERQKREREKSLLVKGMGRIEGQKREREKRYRW